MNIAILGGGIAGLSSALRLAQSGAQVSVFESGDRLGGLGTWFEYEGLRLDKWYHVILDSDTYLRKLLDDLDLTRELRWVETHMGFFVRGKCYAFNSAVDLLKFGALRFHDRIRTGLAAMYITKLKKNGIPLDDELAHVWLRRLFGPRVYRDIWEPLLTAKFGDLRERVPAYWVWNTLNREKNGSQEVKGAVRGGYPQILDALERAIRQAGGKIHLNTPVRGIEAIDRGMRLWLPDGEQDFDAAISTLPLPQLRGLAGNGLEAQIPLPDLAYQGVVNVVLVTRQRLDRYYWTAVVDSGFAFQGVVETTHVIDPAWIGGRHLLYVMNYCSANTPLYNRPEEDLKRDAIEGLARLYPRSFDPRQVESAHVFRAPFVEPVWPLGYLRQRPAARVGGTRLFVATTAQAYPMVTSWNTSVKLADDAIQALKQVCGDVAAPTPLSTMTPARR